MAYAKRYVGGFIDKPTLTTPIDSTFLNAVEAALLKLYALDPSDAQIMAWVNANSRFEPTLIKNANIDPAAGIAKSKLAALSITDADVAGAAAIAQSKLALSITNAQVDAAAAIDVRKLSGVSKVTYSTLAGGPPASPQTTDIWVAATGSANGGAWMFMYDSTIGDAYKWVFIGGAAVADFIAALDGTTSATFVALTNAGPSITVARAGVYIIEHGCDAIEDGSSYAGMSYDIGGSAASDNEAVWQGAASSPNQESTGATARTKTLTAGTALVAKYRTTAAGAQVRFRNRWMKVTPVRIA